MSTTDKPTRPFSRYEWMIAGRYLRARRKEGFISVIAVLSFIGIMLGVGVLVTVMAVMNGFRTELLSKILGFDGHIAVYGQGITLTDYDDIVKSLEEIDGVVQVIPVVQNDIMAQGPTNLAGGVFGVFHQKTCAT